MSDTTGSISLSDRTKHKPDYQLLVCVGIMVPFGLVMVYSASFVEGFVYYNNGLHYLLRQLFAAVVGTLGLLVAQRTNYRWWRNQALPLFIASLILLFVTGFILPRSITEVNGSRSWIRLGFFSVQPSEFVKLTLIIYLASWLSRRGTRLTNVLYGTIPFGVIVGLVTALVMVGKDLGSATIIVAVSALIYFVAGASIFHLFCAGLLGLVSFLVGINVAAYRLDRINAWLDPFAYYSGAGFQPLHALYALASGGIFGVGLGQSRQKYLWLPQSYTDTILAIIGEEMGLIGTLFVVGCFAFVAYRGFKIASSAPNTFGALLATGITLWLVVQAIINLAVVTSLAPFTGITLPFLSYGGTSLMISMVSAGILLNISKYTLADDARPGVLRLAYERFRIFIAALAPFWRRDGGPRLSLFGSRRSPRKPPK